MKSPFGPAIPVLFFAAIAAAAPAFAQDADGGSTSERVLISAARLGNVRTDLLGSSATVLEPLDLELRQTGIVSDILRDVPGIAVSRSGALGQFTQIRVRGAESNHTLTMIDGIKASDPFFGEFDFASLLADDFARIEVLRGEQSALYGSDAIGGVIHYITATGAEAPGIRARAEGGSFGTAAGTLRVAGVADGFDYALSGAYYRTDGTPDSRFGARKLGSENGAVSGKFSYSFADNFRVKTVLRYSALDADLNRQDFNYPPGPAYGYEIDDNGHYISTALYGLLGAEYEGMNGHWKNAFSVQGADLRRDGFGNNGAPAGLRTSGDKGGRVKASYVTSLDFGTPDAAQKITAAFDYEDEFYQNTDPTGYADTKRRHGANYGYVVNYNVVFDERLALGASGRYDQNYRFADAFTYHLQASYRFDNGLRPHAALGTGFKAPNVYELYGYTPGPGSYVGNPDLKPETSFGWEMGFDQSFLDGMAVAGLTYFHSTLEDEIFTAYNPPTFAASPQNATTNSTRQGIEASLSARIDTAWRIDFAYTYLYARQNGTEEVRRAPHIASANIAWRAPDGRYGLNLTVRYNGEQKDNNFTATGGQFVTLPSYTLVNVGADFRIDDMWQIYGRVENLLGTAYEEVYTIRSPGRAFYAGVRATLP
jgi:vitamin B12 transporter